MPAGGQSEKSVNPKINPRLVLAIGIAGVSFSAVLVRSATAPALALAALRLGFTCLLLTPVVLLRHRAQLKTLRWRDLARSLLSGAFLALHFACWFEAIHRTTIASAAALVNTDVLFTALGFALFLKGGIPRLGVVAIGLTFLGSVLVAASAGGQGAVQLSGVLLALAGGLFFSVYFLIGSVQRRHLSTTVYTWLTYTACFVVLLALCGVTGTPVAGWGAQNLLIALAMAVLCTLLGHSLLNWSVKYLSPAFVSAAKLAEPVVSAILAAILFSEVPGPLQLAGAVLVLGGILLYSLAEGRGSGGTAAE